MRGDASRGTRIAGGGLPLRYAADGSGAIEKAAAPKEIRTFDGSEYVLEYGIRTDFALVRARRGDRHGNLIFAKSARNFNPLAAMAGRVTLAEVEELVEPGDLDPDQIHLPGVFVHRLVALTADQAADKQIEKRTLRTGAVGV